MRTRDDGAPPRGRGRGGPRRRRVGRTAAPETAAFFTQDVAYHRALDWRFATGSFNSPGPPSAWTRPQCELVAGEPMTPLQHLLVMTDAASGISAALDWSTTTLRQRRPHASPCTAHRGASGSGMDARTVLGGTGAAQCFAVLFDASGAIGRSAQSLFVEPR